jgi:hypothetical protein
MTPTRNNVALNTDQKLNFKTTTTPIHTTTKHQKSPPKKKNSSHHNQKKSLKTLANTNDLPVTITFTHNKKWKKKLTSHNFKTELHFGPKFTIYQLESGISEFLRTVHQFQGSVKIYKSRIAYKRGTKPFNEASFRCVSLLYCQISNKGKRGGIEFANPKGRLTFYVVLSKDEAMANSVAVKG